LREDAFTNHRPVGATPTFGTSAFGLNSAISAPSALNNKPVRQYSLFFSAFFAFFAVKDLQPSSAGY
jgi:hypothetical protein